MIGDNSIVNQCLYLNLIRNEKNYNKKLWSFTGR